MTDEPKNDPRSRMRALLAGGEQEEHVDDTASPLSRLPRKKAIPAFLPEEEASPPLHLEAIQPPPKPASVKKKSRLNLGPPFWTVTGMLSLIVNAILIAVLAGLLVNIRTLKIANVMDMGSGLLGGLYTNFEKMDRAHIRTNIPVETTIPVKFDLQLNQQTNVVLSQDVTIDRAIVTVKTGGLNITNAVTTIVLPAGTNLPIVLNLTVPVDTTVPVKLNVPVDIAMVNTELHEPFVGLRDVIEPFYCMIRRDAVNMDGQAVCD